MKDKTISVSLICIRGDIRETQECLVVREQPLTLFVNGQEFLTTLCTPVDLNYLVAGILESEGIIHDWNDISDIRLDIENGTASVTTSAPVIIDRSGLKPLVASGGGKGNITIQSSNGIRVAGEFNISAGEIRNLMPQFLTFSDTYRHTRGVHSAALCRDGQIIYFNDDIGRHNALDKVAGWRLAERLEASKLAVITSGRISSEILLKTARRGFPVIISKAPPTDLGVGLAIELGITMVRWQEDSICVYSHDWRVS